MGTMIPLGYQVTNEMIAGELSCPRIAHDPLVVADLLSSASLLRLRVEHQRAPFDVILHVGDLAYAGVSSGGEWEPTWVSLRRSSQIDSA